MYSFLWLDNTPLYIQLILIIYKFCFCEFAYSLKLICNPRVNTCGSFVAIEGHVQSGKRLTHLMLMFPAEDE